VQETTGSVCPNHHRRARLRLLVYLFDRRPDEVYFPRARSHWRRRRIRFSGCGEISCPRWCMSLHASCRQSRLPVRQMGERSEFVLPGSRQAPCLHRPPPADRQGRRGCGAVMVCAYSSAGQHRCRIPPGTFDVLDLLASALGTGAADLAVVLTEQGARKPQRCAVPTARCVASRWGDNGRCAHPYRPAGAGVLRLPLAPSPRQTRGRPQHSIRERGSNRPCETYRGLERARGLSGAGARTPVSRTRVAATHRRMARGWRRFAPGPPASAARAPRRRAPAPVPKDGPGAT
jgi:hypothetical protein